MCNYRSEKGIRQVIVPEKFAPQRDARGHVRLGRTAVIVMQRGINTSSVKGTTVHQEAAHREVGARKAPTLLDLNKALTNEVFAVICHFLHVTLANLLL